MNADKGTIEYTLRQPLRHFWLKDNWQHWTLPVASCNVILMQNDGSLESNVQKIVDSRTCESYRRSGLRLVSMHQELDAGKKLHLWHLHHSWTRDIRSFLPGLRRKRTGLLVGGPKSSFQSKVSYGSFVEIKGKNLINCTGYVNCLVREAVHSGCMWALGCQLTFPGLQPSVNHSRGSVRFWDCISAYGTGIYQKILIHCAFHLESVWLAAVCLFQHDSAPKHTATEVKAYLDIQIGNRTLSVMNWAFLEPGP